MSAKIAFEIIINGQGRSLSAPITAITLVCESVARRQAERVSLHAGNADGSQIHGLDASLQPGDEIVIRIVENIEDSAVEEAECSFCGAGGDDVLQLIRGPGVAICDPCIASFRAVLTRGARLPMGTTMRDADSACGFCGNVPPVVPGVFVRNQAAICGECLRACSDIIADAAERRG